MPSVLAAKIDLWSNPHPLGLSTKDSVSSSGWDLDREDSQSGHEQEENYGDLINASLRDLSSLHSTTSSRAPRPRPAARSENQKVIEVRNRIFVGGLTEAINEDDLRGLFGQYGQVVEVAIKARGGDQFRGFGFVTFCKNSEAAEALRDCAGEHHSLHGRKINVCAAFKRVDKVSGTSGASGNTRNHQQVSLPPVAAHGMLPPSLPPAGWMGPPPGLPVLYNPYYCGPPVIANGMWIYGPGMGIQQQPPPPFSNMPAAYAMGAGGGAMFPAPLPPTHCNQADTLGMLGHDIGISHGGASLSESRMSMDGGFQPIGTKNSAVGADFGHGSFATQPLTAPWFMPL